MTVKIAVLGHMRSGKDTFAEPLIKQEGFYQLKFSGGIRELISDYFPEVFKEGKPRKHYQVIGQTFRQLDPDVWVKRLEKEFQFYQMYGIPDTGIVITDVRQPNEIQWCIDNGFTLVKLCCGSEIRKQRIIDSGDQFEPEQFYHETESHISAVKADYTINSNCSIEELQQKAVEIALEIKAKQGEQ